MKRKKSILCCSLMAFGIIITSKMAYAGSQSYSTQLPSHKEVRTIAVIKGNDSTFFTNIVKADGIPKTKVNWAGYASDGTRETVESSFYNTGTSTASYGTQAHATYLWNTHLYMKMKTAVWVFKPVDVRGVIYP